MKKRVVQIIAAAATLSMIPTITGCATETKEEAVYLGVLNEDEATRTDVLGPDSKVYRFLVDGEEKLYSVDGGSANYKTEDEYYDAKAAEDGAYVIQNSLIKGDSYEITVRDDKVVRATSLEDNTSDYTPVIDGVAGKKTLKNFIATCFEPMGTALFMYGGGWDFQDIGSGNESRTIGVPKAWVDFYNMNDANYTYDGVNENGILYHPDGYWNKYAYYGLDSSGYIGWATYNILNTTSMTSDGYVYPAQVLAQSYAEKRGLGTFTHFDNDSEKEYSTKVLKYVQPGDIVSIHNGAYIVVGKCSDDSLVVISCKVSDSSTGVEAGGVQLSAINADGTDSKDCEAYELASLVMDTYYSDWVSRYPVQMCEVERYLNTGEEDNYGVFRWNKTLTDKEGYASMSAYEVLGDLFLTDIFEAE